jgi:serine/threonine protein kinase/Tol biopolymer transport system component
MERFQQIEEIFQEALQRDSAGRDVYVRRACHGDIELEREVLSLLANHDSGATFEPWATAAALQLINASSSLRPGQSLGPYRIEAFLAAGGMGEVYRATDTRLNRAVAIKVSAARFSERFEREARVIASLNHPNICTLYDVGPNYLVMELVEGPTLADRIRQGALPLNEALAIVHQIAEALEAAHEKGRVHRDLKPANVKITPEGLVKLLDFGLAKAAEERAAAGNPSDSPTQTISATRAGVILGTAAYMSPEQARGATVDRRTDIWAFGSVAYEMLSGKPAFRGETTTDILAAVLKEEPDWSRIPANAQPLLRRCLVKDPKHRLRDIGDAMPLLDGVPEAAPARRPWVWIGLAGLLALALPVVWQLRPKSEERLLQLEISAPPGHSFGAQNLYRYAISPDGGKLAFVATSADGKRSLWVRPLDSTEAVRLPGTEGAIGPFWDPASRWIAFGANGKLQRIDVTRGQPQVLCDVADPTSGTWSRDGVILFWDHRTIRRVFATGGASSPVLSLDEARKENGQFWPQLLPDGRRFLYFSIGQQYGAGLGSLDGKSEFLMINPDSPGLYATSQEGKAYLLFLRRDQLIAQPFDAKAAALSGEPLAIAAPLQTGGLSFSASENGVLIFRHSQGGRTQLTWFDREGKPLGTAGGTGYVYSPRISPDQKSVAFYQREGMSFDVWLFDEKRSTTTRFSHGSEMATYPVWSPDGSRIVHQTRRSNEFMIIERPASGIGKETILWRAPGGGGYSPQSRSRDGRWLLIQSPGDFQLLPMGPEGSSGERKLIPLPESHAEGRHPSISPDGRWLLYSSTQTGSREVFIESMPAQMGGPAAGAKKQVSIAGGTQPVWRADGKEIFYLATGGKLMAVSVDASPFGLQLGKPQSLFQTRLEFDLISRQYDVAPDGKRFLLAQPLEGSASVPITVIVNWPALLKRGAAAR